MPHPGISSVHVETELDWRGGEQQVLSLVEGLCRRGQPAVLVASPRSRIFERARAAGLDLVGIHAWNEADPHAIFLLARLLKRLRPAVLHLHSPHAHLLGVLAAALAPPVRRVVARRVYFSIYRHLSLGLNWIKYRFGVDRFIAVSRAVGDLLIEDGVPRERVAVVHSGVDPGRFAELPPAQPDDLLRELALPAGLPIVLSVGALADHKGHRFLFEAAPRILRRRDAAFVVAGAGPRRHALERLARRLGIAGRVRFAGFRSDVGRLLRNASVFAFPSLREGLGTSLLDALILERPVVASRAGGIPEVIGHREHGLLVPPRDPEALAAAVVEVFEDPGAAAARGRAGRARVLGEFTAAGMVEGTLRVYRELLG